MTTQDISLTGGAGDDSLVGGKGNDTLDGAKGNDTLTGGDGNDILYGDAGNDTLVGGGGGDSLYGGTGDDTLDGGGGDDTLYGGEGRDTFVFAAGDGSAHVADFEAGETIRISGVPGGFAGLVIEQIGDNAVIGHGDGDEITLQGVSADSLGADDFEFPAAGNAPRDGGDAPQGASPGDTPSDNGDTTTDDSSGGGETTRDISRTGGAGDDSLVGGKGDDTLDGGKGNDTLTGGDGNDILHGGAGDDTLNGGYGIGKDTLYGGSGDDTLYGGGDKDTLYGGDGDDTLNGGDESGDTDFSNNTLYGGGGNDTLYGDYGNDTLYGGSGDDTLEGGWGFDTFVFRAGDGNDTITDFWTDFRGRGGDKIHLSGISGGFGALDIRQDGDDAIIRYGAGGDTVTLLGVRAEFLDAGDFKFGASYGLVPSKPERAPTPLDDDDWDGKGAGTDLIRRGTDGDDKITLFGGWSGVLLGGGGDDILNCSYGRGDDILHGGSGDDTLTDSWGDDTLYGGSGDDTLTDSWGDDTLTGGSGDDTLHGGDGDDTLDGGEGDDTLTGGAGSDTFVFRLFQLGTGDDTIADFGEGDRIRIDGFSGGFGALDIRQEGDDAIIRHGGGTIRLQGVKADSLGAGDFQFGALPPPKPGVPIVETFTSDDPLSDDWNGKYSSVGPIKKGTAGNDTLTAKVSGLAGVLLGGDGDDTLIGGSGDQVLHGGSGNDTLHGGSGGDRSDLYGRLSGYHSSALYGGSGDDTLHDGSGNDILYGGAGADTFVFRTGGGYNIIADFGEGDRIRIDGDSDGFGALDIRQYGDDAIIRHGGGTVSLKGVKADSLGAGDFQFGSHGSGSAGLTLEDEIRASSILTGGGGDDTLHGRGGDDTLHGGDGDDTLDSGGFGDSTLNGGDGDDTLYGGHGDDTLNGGAGDDTLLGSWGSDIYVFRAGDGNDIIIGFRDVDDLMFGVSDADKIHILGVSGGFEALDIRHEGANTIIGYGGDGDTITLLNPAVGLLEASDFIFGAYPIGDSGDDSLHGGSGTDTLYGHGGDDTLYGHGGDDILYGGNGADTLTGGRGADTLYGGHGDDIMQGSLTGDDTFVFTNDTSSSGDVDTILDFASGDTIQLSGFAGVDDFGDLEGRIITTHGRETIIDLRDAGGGLIVLEYVAQLDADDFDFG